MQLPNAFVTLLTTPSYLPGALVLLHSLNELHPAPREYKTVCLITPETVDAKTIGELRKAGWDFVIGVEPIGSGEAGEKGLRMMGRPDLNYALTKLHLFRLHTLFSTLIYLDADVLPLRPLAHLFQTTNPHTLSACSDTGWPDCFNSGVMVIRPKESDWTGLRNLLKNGEGEEGIYLTGDEEAGGNGSFDGADQGLLNEWFSEEGGGGAWNRLPFTYNVTPSAAYTYKPAYHRYGHRINVVHFIGPNKPWANLAGRPAGMSVTKKGKDSYNYPALIDRWYDVYDRNVRPTAAHAPDLAHRFAVPEHVAVWNLASGVPAQPQDRLDLDQLRDAVDKGVTSLKPGQYISLPLDGRVDLIMPKPKPKKAKSVKFDEQRMESPGAIASPTQYHAPLPQTIQQQLSQPAIWDAVHHAPPQKGGPEMSIRMDTFYAPAWEQTPAQQAAYYQRANERQPEYPTLPESVTSDTWYSAYSGKVPDKRNIKPVFPWEQPGQSHRAPDRVFPRGSTPPPQQSSTPSVNVQNPTPPLHSPPHRQPSPPQPRSMSDAMASYTNAWDSMPSIQRYVKQITGRSNAPTSLGMGRRESTFDPASIQSVPPTPRVEHPEKKSKAHKRDASIDRHSEASADGDDEEEESSEDDSGPSPFVPTAEWKAGHSFAHPSHANTGRYQDRFAQTDNAIMADAKVQAIPGGGPSPAVKTVDLPPSATSTRRNSATGKRPGNVRNSSSSASASTSDALRTSSGPLTPTSDSTVTSSTRRVPFPAGPGHGAGTGPYTASPVTTAKGLPTHSAKSSFGGSYGKFSSSNFADAGQHGQGGHGRRPSTEARTNEGVPLGRGSGLPQIGEGQARSGPGRYFSPETDLDERKKDSHAVLTRFMREASHAQSGGLGLK